MGPLAGRHGPGRLHEPRRDRVVPGQAARASSTRASTASRPTSASASRSRSSTSTGQTRRGCTTSTRSSTTRPCTMCWSRREGRGRRRAVRALGDRRRPVDARALGRRLDLDVRVDGRDPARRAVARAERIRATGATTSAASKAHRMPVSSSAGRRSACSARTAASTVRARTGCRGRSTRRRWRSRASSRSSRCVSCRTCMRRASRRQRAGTPIMRPMPLEFPDDPAAAYLDRQYMLGCRHPGRAGVLRRAARWSSTCPAGTWTNLLTGEEVVGGVVAPRDGTASTSLPLYVRPGAVIPWGARSDRPDYDYLDGLRLRVFAGGSGTAEVTRHDPRRAFRDVHGGPVGDHALTAPFPGAVRLPGIAQRGSDRASPVGRSLAGCHP